MILVARYFTAVSLGQTNLFALFRLLIILASLLVVGCSNKPEIIQISGSKMGTTYQVTIVADQIPPDDLAQRIDDLLATVNNSMSTYKQDSEISQFNRMKVGDKMVISKEFAAVIQISREVWLQSNGAFDPTIGPLVDLWGFGAGSVDLNIPPDDLIAAALNNTGFQHVQLNDSVLSKTNPVELDLSAVAKGYGVDLVADLLEMLALPDYLVEVGGEIRVSGLNPSGDQWRVAIEQPQLPSSVDRVLELSEIAIATSGDYRNYFEQDGVRYSHTIDPRLGMPVEHGLASVTVLSKSCAEADAWATAFTVMGADRSIEVAERLGLAVYLMVREEQQFRSLSSAGFKPYLEPPSTSNKEG
jgi:thiamine biosynthesis lipoprotein